jgi:16S rRNA (guanine527-N7)-methyltransferase
MQELFQKHDLASNEKLIQDLEKFLGIFMDWNAKINLSGLRERDDIILKQFVDSLLVTKCADFSQKKILDLGTGGGFPSIPLSLYYQHIHKEKLEIVAIDSRQKKLKVVDNMAESLGIEIQTVSGRAEEIAHHSQYRAQFDIVLTRAFAPWPVLLELALPFIKVGGKLIAYQGPAIKEELVAGDKVSKLLGGSPAEVQSMTLDNDIERLFVFITKLKKTAGLYPRSIGIPKKTPLVL